MNLKCGKRVGKEFKVRKRVDKGSAIVREDARVRSSLSKLGGWECARACVYVCWEGGAGRTEKEKGTTSAAGEVPESRPYLHWAGAPLLQTEGHKLHPAAVSATRPSTHPPPPPPPPPPPRPHSNQTARQRRLQVRGTRLQMPPRQTLRGRRRRRARTTPAAVTTTATCLRSNQRQVGSNRTAESEKRGRLDANLAIPHPRPRPRQRPRPR